MTDKQWFIEQFDTFVGEDADGRVLEKSRDAIARVYLDGVESGELTPWRGEAMEEARALFDRVIKPVRERRRDSMRTAAESLVDALNGDTLLGDDDPVLDHAFPLGDGCDKALRFWTRDDWRGAATERYRNAAAVTEAARRFDAVADLIAQALVARGVNTTGALFAT